MEVKVWKARVAEASTEATHKQSGEGNDVGKGPWDLTRAPHTTSKRERRQPSLPFLPFHAHAQHATKTTIAKNLSLNMHMQRECT